MQIGRRARARGGAVALMAAAVAAATVLGACSSEPASSTGASGNEGSVGGAGAGAGAAASFKPGTQELPSAIQATAKAQAVSDASLKHVKVGALRLQPASGSANSVPKFSTTAACPSGYQGSAVLFELNRNGSIASQVGEATQLFVTTPFSGEVIDKMGTLLALTDVPRGHTDTWAFACYPNGDTTGTGPKYKWSQAIYVTLSADGNTYTTSTRAG